MSLVHLYDNYVGPPGAQGGFSGSYELGSRFSSSLGVAVVKLGWYATNTTTSDKPSALTLWDVASQTALATVGTVPHNGSVGMQWATLNTPVVLAPGVVYCVSATLPAYASIGASSSNAAAPTPLAWASSLPRCQSAYQGGGSFPNSTSSYYWWVDVEVDTAGGGGPGAGPSDTGNALVAWLADTSDNTHRYNDSVPGLPDVTNHAVGLVKTVTDRLDDLSDDAIAWLNDRSSQLTDFLNGVNSGAVAALNNLASRITGSGAGGGSAFYGSGGLQVAQAAEDTLALLQLIAALQRNALVDFPGSPWVQTDTTTFDTSLAWAVEADLYVVSFSDLGGAIVNLDAAGVDVSYRLAWWCPLIGAFGQQRRFIDFPDAHLWLDGQRMPGLLLHSPKGATGSVQAWTYD